MVDYSKLGREAILAASEAELEVLKKAEKPRLASRYGATTDIYEIALRRIGEGGLAGKFVNPNPEVDELVKRVSSYESILTAIIANTERGNKKFARVLEQTQRELFYLEGAGYWDPHWRMPHMMKNRERVRQQIIERKSPELGIYERVDESWWGREESDGPSIRPAGFQLGDISLYEAILAIAANAMLGRKKHAQKVLNTLFDLYQEGTHFKTVGEKFLLELNYAASICKLADLLGDSRGRELYEKRKAEIKSGQYAKFSPEMEETRDQLPAVVYSVDHFEGEKEAEELREKIASLDLVHNKKVVLCLKDHQMCGPAENITLLKLGLALTGLEPGKPNYFYTPSG